MKLPRGKGMFIWQILRCESGNYTEIARQARLAGLGHVLIKIADTIFAYNVVSGVDLVPPLIAALKAEGIEAWGWHYVKGDDPGGEANRAIARIKQLDLAGYVIDAEGEYKQTGKAMAASFFMQSLRAHLPDFAVALSSYRYPSFHPQFPWHEFLKRVDFAMPQVYWMQATNPGAQLAMSWKEYRGLAPSLPYIPTGAAYKEHGWAAKPAEVQEFLEAADLMGLEAVNFWSWDSCRGPNNGLFPLWDVIAAYKWGGPDLPPAPLPAQPELPDPIYPEVSMSKLLVIDLLEDKVIHTLHSSLTGSGAVSLKFDVPAGVVGLAARIKVEGKPGAFVFFGNGNTTLRQMRLGAFGGDEEWGLVRFGKGNLLWRHHDAAGGEVSYSLIIDGYLVPAPTPSDTDLAARISELEAARIHLLAEVETLKRTALRAGDAVKLVK